MLSVYKTFFAHEVETTTTALRPRMCGYSFSSDVALVNFDEYWIPRINFVYVVEVSPENIIYEMWILEKKKCR